MKKIFWSILLSFFCWISYWASLQDLGISFCNNQSWVNHHAVDFIAQSGKPYEFCLKIENSSNEIIPISIEFVDAVVSNDSFNSKICSTNSVSFAPYVYLSGTSFTIPWNTAYQKTGLLQFPPEYSGAIHGCLVYNIPKTPDKTQKASWFDIIVRKWIFIDGLILGNYSRNLFFNSKKIDYHGDSFDNWVTIVLPFDNKSPISEYIQFTWSLSNSLWYERLFSSWVIIKWDTWSLLSFHFENLPFYKWVYRFHFEWISSLSPHLDTSLVPDSMKKSISFGYEKNIYIIPWKMMFVVLILIFILLFIKLLLKKIVKR